MKTRINFLLIFVLLFISGCTGSKLFVANSLAGFGEYSVHRDIPYDDGVDQRLDIYVPSSAGQVENVELPTVVFFYGGCWGACSDLRKEDYRFVAQALAENNIVAVIADYRQFPEALFPEIMNDAKHSIEWISQNIGSYGGSEQNIFLMGHSAGAHIASMLNFNEHYLTPSTYKQIKGFIGLAGPYDFLPFDEPYQPELFSPPESYPESQTINFVDGTEPPSLLMYGNSDTRVKRRNILSLTDQILVNHGQVKTLYYDDIDHVGIIGSLSIPLRSSKTILKDIVSFIAYNYSQDGDSIQDQKMAKNKL